MLVLFLNWRISIESRVICDTMLAFASLSSSWQFQFLLQAVECLFTQQSYPMMMLSLLASTLANMVLQ